MLKMMVSFYITKMNRAVKRAKTNYLSKLWTLQRVKFLKTTIKTTKKTLTRQNSYSLKINSQSQFLNRILLLRINRWLFLLWRYFKTQSFYSSNRRDSPFFKKQTLQDNNKELRRPYNSGIKSYSLITLNVKFYKLEMSHLINNLKKVKRLLMLWIWLILVSLMKCWHP